MEGMVELLPATLALDRRRVREHAETRFSFQRMVEGYVGIYEKMRGNAPI